MFFRRMESERDGPRVAPEPTMRSDLEEMPELSDTMMAPEEESDDVINVPEVCLRTLEGFQFRWSKIKGIYTCFPISITLCFNHLKYNVGWTK